MSTEGTRAGRIVQGREPNWTPFESAVAEISGGFMWMFEVRLSDGLRAQAYKHYLTRRYAHLAHGGRAFSYTSSGRCLELPTPEPWGCDAAMWAVLEAATWPRHEPEPLGWQDAW